MYRILHVFDVSIPIHAGYTFRSRAILTQQRALGWTTFHVTSSKHQSKLDVEDVEGFRFHRTHSGSLAKLPVLGQWDVVRTLKPNIIKLAKEYKPDIIHAHSPLLTGLAAVSAGKSLGIPVVYECRAFWEDAAVDTGTITEGNTRYKVTRALESRVFRNADAVVCISQGLYDDINARGIPASKITMVPNAVNLEQFKVIGKKDQELEAKLGLGGKTVLGFFGSFYAYEGIDLAIESLAELRKHIPNIHLLLLGGGNEDQNLRNQVQRLGLTDHVTFTGRVPQSEVPRYGTLVDAFTFPRKSLRLTEIVTPLKPLESMAQGKLVIASDVGGHRELIKPDVTGYLHKADDLDSLTKVTLKALTDLQARDRIVDQGLNFVHTERSWQAIAKRYGTIYGALKSRS